MSINQMGLNIIEKSRNNLSIYVHIPFCESKCAYCSFVSMVSNDEMKKQYFDNLMTEIKIKAKQYSPHYSVASIYIGGGTPSCLDNYYIRDLLSSIYKNFAVKNTAEITIEINPNTADKNKIREYILAGVNRFSIGLQSSNPKILKSMGRLHTYNDFVKAVSIIREYGIKNISADIILGYPNQKLADIKDTMTNLIKLEIPHISAYMLSVDEGTKLKTLVDNGAVGLPDEDLVVQMYNLVLDMLTKAGYGRYEFSNFAKPTFESYHNRVYWNRTDYIGLGLAAHSYIQGTRFANTENLNEYILKLNNENVSPIVLSKNLSKAEQKEEAIMLSMRTATGLNLEIYKSEFGENLLSKKKDRIADLIKNGYIKLTADNRLVCTSKGFLVLNQIVLELAS